MRPYVFYASVEGVLILALGTKLDFHHPKTHLPSAILTLMFSAWTIYGAGPQTGFRGLVRPPIYIARPEQADKLYAETGHSNLAQEYANFRHQMPKTS